MTHSPDQDRRSTGQAVRRAGLAVTALFWALQYAELAFLGILGDPTRPQHAALAVAPLAGLGFLLTAGLLELAIWSLPKAPVRRAVAVLGGAVATCGALVAANYLSFALPSSEGQADTTQLLYRGFALTWFFLSLGAAILAAFYMLDLKDREGRLERAREEARNADMRSLRFQLNPRFVFNTLDSVKGLVGRGRLAAAEHVVENLSDFLRTSLELDPHDDISLAREMGLQKLYLRIEALRLEGRLTVESSMPAELARAVVPSLVTQPLVENAVRRAVAAGNRAVTIRISASSSGRQLRIEVEDDAEATTVPEEAEHRMGLEDAAARLKGRFGEEADAGAGPGAGDGHVTWLRLPLRIAG